MDPVTHFTSGALAGRALSDRFGALEIMIFCLVAAGLPDIDSLVGFGAEQYLLHHRGFTHSVVGVPLLAAAWSGLFKLFRRNAPYWMMFAVAVSVMTLQVYLDLATTFGTMILWPFSHRRFAFPGVFIIDPLFTGALLLLLVLSFAGGRKMKRSAVIGLAAAVLYPLVNLTIGAILEKSAARGLLSEQKEIAQVHVTTDLFTPVYWKVVAEAGDRIGVGALGPGLSNSPDLKFYPRPDPHLVSRLAEQARFFRTWIWFARFPAVYDARSTDGGREIVFVDLRFYSRSPIGRKLLPEYRPPFMLTVRLDRQGALRTLAYNGHEEEIGSQVAE